MKLILGLAACVFRFSFGISASISKHLADNDDMGTTPKDVILFMGQSNCAGLAKLDDLKKIDPSWLDPPDNMVAPLDTPKDEVKFFPWRPRTSELDTNFGNVPGSFGAELSFGKMVASMYKNDTFAIKKHCVSGTSLAEDWLESFRGGESLSSSAVHWMRLLKRKKECVRGRCRLKAIMWIQGEEDSMHEEMSVKYLENLFKLFHILRSGAKDHDLPVFIVELPSTGWTKEPFWKNGTREVREAQEAYVKKVGNKAVLIPAMNVDSIKGKHYNAEMQVELGRRLARPFLYRFS